MFRVMSVMTTSIPLHKITVILYHTVKRKSIVFQKINNITKEAEHQLRFFGIFSSRNILPLNGGISIISLSFSALNLVFPFGVVPL